ncbi:MAG TPA: nuclear transport factor 2 family protein [Chthoniobacterales bacterium]|nr:nuclear transport factor 2 family protein [Chthoniobacterales bacterium]
MNSAWLKDFAASYTAAWCSHDASAVAAHHSESSSLTINDGKPSVGRVAITAAAQEFITAFPDMVVTMADVAGEGNHIIYRWTLTGTNNGPGGTDNKVRISGYEEWRIGLMA